MFPPPPDHQMRSNRGEAASPNQLSRTAWRSNPSGEVACWYESSHNPKVWFLADLPSNEHRTCSTPAWWHRILTTPSLEWEGRSSGSSGKDGSSESST